MTVFTTVPIWAWLALSALFFAAGEFLSKEFALNPGWALFALFIAVDLLSALAWLPAIYERNMSGNDKKAAALWQRFSAGS